MVHGVGMQDHDQARWAISEHDRKVGEASLEIEFGIVFLANI